MLASYLWRTQVRAHERDVNLSHNKLVLESKVLTKQQKGHIIKELDSKRERIQAEIRTSRNLEIHDGRQDKHIKGSSNYQTGRSYITVDKPKLEQLIKEKTGTGRILFDDRGRWTNKEQVDIGIDFGVSINKKTGGETITSRGTIHYNETKKGVHIVPKYDAGRNKP